MEWGRNINFPTDTAKSMYQNGQSIKYISEYLGYGNWTVWNRLRKAGVEFRSKTEQISTGPRWNAGLKGKCPQLAKCGSKIGGWNKGLKMRPYPPKTEETRRKISASLMGHKPTFSTKAKIVPELGHCVRSSWEENICKILKNHGIDYLYEPRMFRLSDGSGYWPDLYLSDYNLYVEIKGWISNRWQCRLADFRQKYPTVKLLVVGEKEYKELYRQNAEIGGYLNGCA